MYFDRRLWALTQGVRHRIVLAVLVGLLAAGAGIARLALLGVLLARIIAGTPAAALTGLLVLTLAAIALRAVLEYWRTMIAHRTAARVQARLRQHLYDHVTALGPGFATRERTGELLTSLVEGVQQLEVYFGQYLPQLGVAALTPALIFAFAAALNGPVALVLLTAALVTLVAPAAWHRLDRSASLARQRAYGAFAADYLDAIQGLATLHAFGQAEAQGVRLATRGRDLARRTMTVLGTNTLTRGITDTGIAIGAAAALGMGAYQVRAGTMSLDALVIVLMLGVEVFRPLRELRALLHQGMLGLAAAEGIFRLLEQRPAVGETAGASAGGDPLSPAIAFDRVTFAYPASAGNADSRRPAHVELTFAVAPGERVGIVGPSGAGKSTLVNLLLRFHDPQQGVVRLGGADIRELSLGRLRRHIAVVSQDTYLFHDTVLANLAMGRPGAAREEIEAAATAANAHRFITRLPDGYHTVVGERGVRLSGGQRQRLAIARALLRDAPVLLLDEALSSVDADNEAVIQEALERLMAGRTTLILAHRLSSVIGADRILVLDRGRLADSGTHAELMARRGLYWTLMSEQARDAGAGAPGRVRPATDGGADRSVERAPRDGDSGAGGEAPATESAASAATREGVLAAEGLSWGDTLAALGRLSRGHHGRLALAFVLGIARVGALLGVGVLSALCVRAVGRGAPFGDLLAALAAVAPLAGALHWLESWVAHDVAYRLLTDMRVAFFAKLSALAPAYLTQRRSGDLVATATHDIELIEYFFAHTIAPAFVAVLVPLAVLWTLGAHAWPLAVVVLPFLAWAGLGPVLRRGRIDALSARAREASGALQAHAVDTVQGLAEIVSFGQLQARAEAFAARARVYVDARMPFLHDLARETALGEAATALAGLAVAAVGAFLAARGLVTGESLPLLTLLAMSAFVPVWEIAQTGRQLADTLAATRRVHAVHAERVPVTDGPGGARAAAGRGRRAPSIELCAVSFTYPGRRRPALSDVSLTMPAGATLAIVGPSGAGKTTLAHLLLRFWDPQAGLIRLGDEDLRRFRLDELRAKIALVAQDTYLFNDTLRANLLLARPEAPAPALARALEEAALADVVAALPRGLDTVLGERGAQLSGGQRQRVAIARALLKDAPVLILDEATSHLDAVSEREVRTALDRLARDRTTVVIAHRLSTVRGAERIAVLDAGRVAEIGTHEDLLARRGLYAHLVSRQLASA